jgi:hypothetical protein
MEPTTSVITDQLTRVALGISVCLAHSSPMVKLHYQRTDYSVVVKNRASPLQKRGGGRFIEPGMLTRSSNLRSILIQC